MNENPIEIYFFSENDKTKQLEDSTFLDIKILFNKRIFTKLNILLGAFLFCT